MSKLIPIRHFFKWATRQNYLLYNPASELELPKVEKRLPKATLSAAEAEIILAMPNTLTDEGLRDRALLEILYSTGIRRGEASNLKRHDLHRDRGVLAVRQGKGRKDRFVPISERAMHWVDKYLEIARPNLAVEPDNDYLLIDLGSLPVGPDKLSRLVAGYIKKSDIGKTGSCHLFRHTVATLMLDNGADIRYVQEMLGHVSIETTEIYTHVSIVKLQQIHRLTHPSTFQEAPQPGNANEPEATAETVLAMLDQEAQTEH